MSKNKQIIIFSLIGLLVLGAVTAVLLLTQPQAEEAEEAVVEDSSINLIDKDAANLLSLSITNSRDSYEIVPSETEGEWTIESIAQAPLVQSTFSSVASAASSLTAKALVEENAADLSIYGLDVPVATFTSTFNDDTSVTLEIGNEAPTESSTYVKLSDSNDVYICLTSRLSSFYNSRFSFVSTAMMDAYDSETAPTIKKLTIERIDFEEPVVIEALPEPEEDEISVYSHKFTSPYDVYLDLNNGVGLLYGMYGLTASRVEWVGMEEKDYELSGLDNPTCTVSMLVEGKIYELKIGKAIVNETTDEATGVTTQNITGYYAMINQVPDVLFVIDPSTAPWMSMTVEYYMSKIFSIPYIYDLQSVSYSDGDNEFEVNIEGNAENNSFFIDGNEVDGDLFKQFYQFLIGAKGETIYTEDEKGELIATYTYTYRDGTTEVVAFYESEDRNPIISVNGQNLFKTKQMYTIRLKQNAEAFLTGGEISLNY